MGVPPCEHPGASQLLPQMLVLPTSCREVHIVDADSFTRDFCSGRGVHLAPAQAYPAQPIEQAIAAKSKPSGGSCNQDAQPVSICG